MPVEIFWHSHLFFKGLEVLLVHRAVAGPASPVRAEVALETVIIMFPELLQIPLPCYGDLVQDKIRYRDRPDSCVGFRLNPAVNPAVFRDGRTVNGPPDLSGDENLLLLVINVTKTEGDQFTNSATCGISKQKR